MQYIKICIIFIFFFFYLTVSLRNAFFFCMLTHMRCRRNIGYIILISRLIKGHYRSQKGDMVNQVKIEKCTYGHNFFYIYAYMISLGITGYVSLTSGNDIGQRRLKEIKKGHRLKVHPGTYIFGIYTCLIVLSIIIYIIFNLEIIKDHQK